MITHLTKSQIGLLVTPPVLLGTTYCAYKELAVRSFISVPEHRAGGQLK